MVRSLADDRTFQLSPVDRRAPEAPLRGRAVIPRGDHGEDLGGAGGRRAPDQRLAP